MRKRGPYRKWSLKMPRQTLYSRKQRKLSSTQGDAEELNSYSIEGSNEDSDEGSNDDCDVESDKESLNSCHVDMPSDSDEPIPSVDQDLLPENLLNVGADLDGNENTEELLQYLYNGCHLTAESAHLLISSFSYRHHLSGQAQEDLLQLLQMLLPKPNNLPTSLYLFHKGETISSGEIVRHYYCLRCFALIEEPKTTTLCPNSLCRLQFCMGATNFFIGLPVEEQIRTLLARKCILV